MRGGMGGGKPAVLCASAWALATARSQDGWQVVGGGRWLVGARGDEGLAEALRVRCGSRSSSLGAGWVVRWLEVVGLGYCAAQVW